MNTNREAGGDVVDAYLDCPEETDMQPYQWTDDDRLVTDPNGIPPMTPGALEAQRDAQVEDSEEIAELRREVVLRERKADLLDRRDQTYLPTQEALRLAEENQAAEERQEALANPARRYLQALRWRGWVTRISGAGIVSALIWSTVNVQHTAAYGVPWDGWVGIAGNLLGFLVEPLLSALLLPVLAARAFLANRGEKLTDPWVRAAFWVPLAYTLVLNLWSHLPAAWLDHWFVASVRVLAVTSVGPAVAIIGTHALPKILEAFTAVTGEGRAPRSATPLTRENAISGGSSATVSATVPEEAMQVVLEAIETGALKPQPGYATPGVRAIGKYLRRNGHRIGDEDVKAIREALK